MNFLHYHMPIDFTCLQLSHVNCYHMPTLALYLILHMSCPMPYPFAQYSICCLILYYKRPPVTLEL